MRLAVLGGRMIILIRGGEMPCKDLQETPATLRGIVRGGESTQKAFKGTAILLNAF